MLIKYEDIKESDEKIFDTLNKFLGLTIDKDIFLLSVSQARFENIQKIEEAKGMTNPSKMGTNFQFARSGKTGQWTEMLNADDIEYINNTLKKYNIDLFNF